ncbi:WD40 domain-containing protein [Sediminitomix flava]|uniref:WD40 repeat protein n=1 Tax=Sediminitomix flava TaxID=379075 RepID=A0A315Z8V2_SEDFL|nr:caspase family protein [Sediminitomix flava]PWJ42006.1 WD40 repeat protein [Sediminitomix flava]
MKILKPIYQGIFLLFIPIISVFAQSKPTTVLELGHSKAINDVAFSNKGDLIATVSDDKTIKIWDLLSGKEVKTLYGHKEDISSIYFSYNDKYLLSGSGYKEKLIHIWDVEKGNIIRTISNCLGKVHRIVYDGAREQIITAEGDFKQNAVRVYDFLTGDKKAEYFYNTPKASNYQSIQSLEIAPVRGLLITGSTKDKKSNLKIYNYPEVQKPIWEVNPKSVADIAYSSNRNLLVAVGHEIHLYDSYEKTLLKSFIGSGNAVALADNGAFFIVAKNKEAYLYNIEGDEKSPVVSFKNGHKKKINKVALSPDANFLVTVSEDNQLILWDVKSGQIIPAFQSKPAVIGTALGFDPETQSLTVGTASAGLEKVNLVAVNTAKSKIDLGKLRRNDAIENLSYPSAGKNLLLMNTLKGTKVKVLDPKSKRLVVELSGGGYLRDSKFSPDRAYLASGSTDNKVKVWNKDGELIYNLAGHSSLVKAIAFSPDSKFLVSAGADKKVIVWDLEKGEKQVELEQQHQFEINSLVIDPQAQYLISVSGNQGNVKVSNSVELVVWDWKTKTFLKKLSGHSKAINQVSFNKKGNLFATASYDNTIILWDKNTLSQKFKLEGHTSGVTSIVFGDNDQKLFSAAEDRQIKVWDTQKGLELANIITFNNGDDYIISTPDNYYTCSRDGVKSVHFTVNDKIFLFEQFDLRLNRPDLVAKRLGMADGRVIEAFKNAYLKRLDKMGFTEEMLSNDYHVPSVEITNLKDIEALSTTESISLKISAKDEKYNLDRINIWVNDVPLQGRDGISVRAENIKEVEKLVQIPLSDGKNKIQISVLNQKGAESFKKTIFTAYKKPNLKPDLYVVSFGVSEYKDSAMNLNYAAKDAQDIADLFLSQENEFGQVHRLTFFNEACTKENMLKVHEQLMNSKVDDQVVVFFAGHGVLDSNYDYFLGTHDITFDLNRMKEKGLGYEDFENILDKIPARKRLMMIDACHSGEVDEDEMASLDVDLSELIPDADDLSGMIASRGFGMKRLNMNLGDQSLLGKTSFQLMQELFPDLNKGIGAVVIGAAGGSEYALERGDISNGVFTYSLKECFTNLKGDTNKDGAISMSELRHYVFNRVKELTGGKQNPTTRAENLEFDYPLFRQSVVK